MNYFKKAMKSLYLAIILTVLSFFGIKAQESSLLYKIEGNGIKPSYLFGTIHILPAKDFDLSEKVKKAFIDADVIALEIDMDDPGMQAEMMRNIMMKGDVTLNQLLSEEDYNELDEELKIYYGAGISQFNNMKPFFLMSMLLSKYFGEDTASFELTFIKMAKENNKEILGLETVTDQMSIFDKIPYEDQITEVMKLVNDDPKTKKIFVDMLELYKNEDIEGMQSIFEDYYEGDQETIDLILSNRNKKWIPVMNKLAKNQSVFFGVGAGHLGGKEGVVTLLREAGYKVTSITQ